MMKGGFGRLGGNLGDTFLLSSMQWLPLINPCLSRPTRKLLDLSQAAPFSADMGRLFKFMYFLWGFILAFPSFNK